MRLWFAYLLYTSTVISGLPARQIESVVRHGQPPESGIEHRRTIDRSSHAHSEIHLPQTAQKEENFLGHVSLIKLLSPYELQRNDHDNNNQTITLQIKTLISSNSENNSIVNASQSHHVQQDTLSAPSPISNETSGKTSDPMLNDTFHLHYAGHAPDLPRGLTFLNADSIEERNSSKSQFLQANILQSTVGYKIDINSSESEANESTMVAPITDNNIKKQLDSPNEITLDLQTLLGVDGPTAIQHNQKYENNTYILQNHEHNHGDNHHAAHAHTHGDYHRSEHALSHNEYDSTAHTQSKFYNEEISHSLDHTELHSRGAKSKTNVEKNLSKLLDGLTVGLFQKEETHQQDVVVKSTTKSVSRDVTNHVTPMTTRSLQELDSISKFPNTFIDNVLNVQIWNTTSRTTMASAKPSKYAYERNQSNIHTIHEMHHPDVKMKDSQANDKTFHNDVPLGKAAEKQILHSDLLQLQGIHVMFTNGKPDTTGHISTIHLTAHTSTMQQRDPVHLIGLNNDTDADGKSFVEKIVGTAIIKNGHLYLIVYPLGENKSVDLHFAHSAKNHIPIQHIRDTIPLRKNESSTVHTIQVPVTTVPSQLSTSENAVNLSSKSLSSFRKHVTNRSRAHTAHHHKNVHPQGNSHQHHQQQQQKYHQHHHHHGTSTKQEQDTRQDKTDEKESTKHLPPPRFLSPWESLNFSKVMPFISKQRKGDSEDNKNDVVKFVASATDPFEKVVSILNILSNTTSVNQHNSDTVNTLGNISEANAVFNFELKLQRDLINDTHVEKQQNPSHVEKQQNPSHVENQQNPSHVEKQQNPSHVEKQQNPSLFEKQQNPSLFEKQQNPSLFKKQQNPSLFEKQQNPSLFEKQQNPSLFEKQQNPSLFEKQQNQFVNERTFGEQMYEKMSDAIKKQLKLNISGSTEEDTESEMASTKKNDTLLQEYAMNDDSQSLRPLSVHTTISPSQTTTNDNNVHVSPTRAIWNIMERTSPTFNEDVLFTTLSNNDAKRHTPDPINTTRHFLGPFVTTTESPQGVLMSTMILKSTLNNYSNYSLYNGGFKTKEGTVKMLGTPNTFNTRHNNVSGTLHISPVSNSDRPTGIKSIVRQRVVPSNMLGRGQSEQIISLADILNDIRRIRLHSMRRFNIQNNNFNTMIIGDARDKRSSLMTPVMTRKNTLSPLEIAQPHRVTKAAPNVQRERNRQAELNDALEAMLVLSVDDILADHTMLHGAIVLSRRSDSSNSNN